MTSVPVRFPRPRLRLARSRRSIPSYLSHPSHPSRQSPRAVRATAPAAALTLALGLTACSGEPAQTAPTTIRELTAAERLAAAKKQVDDAKTVHIVITSADVPNNASGVLSADGWGAHPPAFKGKFKVQLRGISGDAQVVAVDGKVWAKLPLVPGMNEIDPATFGMPNPATLLTPDQGLTTWLTDTQNPTMGDKTRKGSEVLTTIKGKLPGQKIVNLLVIGDANASYDATYSVTDTHQLRDVALTGPFFGSGTTSTYTVTFDGYNAPQTIEKPA